jgi:competence protein ComFC
MNFGFLSAVFFPCRCASCGKKLREGALCASCRGAIMIARTLFCGDCQKAVPADAPSYCHPSFPYLLGAAGNYENRALKELIHALKFRNIRGAAEPLAEILVRYASAFPFPFAGHTVVPIPLSKRRLRVRGFNQSEEIASRFTRHFSLPLETTWLVRVKHAKPQSETENLAERRENIRGCFAVAAPGAVRGRTIILIDDVTTSGATFLEAATVLRAAGAEKIYALAVARA